MLLAPPTLAKVQAPSPATQHLAAQEAVVLLARPAGHVIVIAGALIGLPTAGAKGPGHVACASPPARRPLALHVPATQQPMCQVMGPERTPRDLTAHGEGVGIRGRDLFWGCHLW